MYAIIRAGGHQEKVSAGEQITVDRLAQAAGEEVRFATLMVHLDDGTVVSDRKTIEEKAVVVGRVLQHFKGEKVDIFNYRQKTGYRRHVGHRQPLTQVEIEEIRFGDAVDRAEEAKAAAEAGAAQAKVAKEAAAETVAKARAERKAAAKKPAAKAKAKPAEKKPAAKKPAAKAAKAAKPKPAKKKGK